MNNEELQEMLYLQLNKTASIIPMLSSSDDMELLDLAVIYKELAENDEIPKKINILMQRAFDLVDAIISSESEFVPSIEKLNKCIYKASEEMANLGKDEPVDDNATTIDTELIVKFGVTQSDILEDFESASLEFDNGNETSLDIIKRILHTWKGEFGVLGLLAFSTFIHEIEELIEDGKASGDLFLKLKDLISLKCERFASGNYNDLNVNEKSRFFESVQQAEIEIPVNRVEEDNNSSKDDDEFQENLYSADPSLMTDFISESTEHIDLINPLLLELEVDPEHEENINSVFRACHTIKGVAGFLALTNLQALAHATENLIDRARSKIIVFNPAQLDILFGAVDCMTEFLENIKNTEEGEAIKNPDNLETVMKRLRAPDSENLEIIPINKKIGEILIESGDVKLECVKNATEKQRDGDCRNIGQILVEDCKVSAKKIGKALASQQAAKKVSSVEESIRVPISRLDKLIDFIGEAVIAQSMVFGDTNIAIIEDSDLGKKIGTAGQIMHQIQELSMSLRMISVKQTFQKMGRIVRDISKKTGKPVNYIIEGEDTELDKTVVENIADPLMHMVRNSVDHGLETPEERAKTDKPEKGRVTLRAFHRAGNIVIEIEDDGKGLNTDILMKKALESGIANPERDYTDREIFKFIFAPGFSTAKEVTDISGRGVGMDVVTKNIELLRGTVDIESELGKGTKFSIKLPLTLAIIDGMLIRVADQIYIIPILSIIESIGVYAGLVEKVLGRGEIVSLRGESMPLIRLAELLGFSDERERVDNDEELKRIIMVVEDVNGKRVGLLVDSIIGQQQVVIKNLGKSMGAIRGMSGGAIMNDGTVSLILDISEIIKLANE